MPDGVKVITNLPDFKKQMAEFGFDIEKNIIRAGVRAAGVVFKKRVEQNVESISKTGLLRRNIILVRPKGQTPGQERQYVGVRAGRQRPKAGKSGQKLPLPFYWSWVEAGHRKIPRGGKITGGRRTQALKRARFDAAGGGKTKPVEYLKRAFQAVGNTALEAFKERLQARINKENATRTPRP